jgi:putative flippase GtrA
LAVLNQERLFRFVQYCTVGAIVAAIDFSLAWMLSRWLSPLIAVSIAYFTAVSCHFLLSKIWVYRCNRRDHARQVGQYALCIVVAWLSTLGVVKLCLSTITTNILLAKLIAVPPITLVGFVVLRCFVFAPPKKSTVDLSP